jgi:hypothetical protein
MSPTAISRNTLRHALRQRQIDGDRLLDEEGQTALEHEILGRAVSEGREHDVDRVGPRFIEHLLRVCVDPAAASHLFASRRGGLFDEVTPADEIHIGELLQTLVKVRADDATRSDEGELHFFHVPTPVQTSRAGPRARDRCSNPAVPVHGERCRGHLLSRGSLDRE